MDRPGTLESPPISRGDMDEWFAKATIAERDALSALQLLYRFQGDNLGNLWWVHLQALGFRHNGTSYELPESAPSQCKAKSYTGVELYHVMDRFAVPQLTSPYQEFPLCPSQSASLTNEERESQEWWQSTRDVLIFKRFRAQTEGFQLSHLPPSSDGTSNPMDHRTNKRRAALKDAGAELFMQKTKKGKKRGKITERDFSSSNVRFPTIRECVKVISESFDLAKVEKNEALLAESFSEWKFQTVMNHSLLCYGAGSKRNVLNRFADELEEDGESVIVIDGFHKDVTIEAILDLISNIWLRGGEIPYNRYDVHAGRQLPVRPFGSCNYPSFGDATVVQRACSISRALAHRANEEKRGYYLILHGIDGVGLRNNTAQEVLATLVSFSTTVRGLNGVRLVASVDHVNGPALLWDSSTYAQFSWIWKVLHTHRPYVEELIYVSHTDENATRVISSHQNDIGDPTEHKAIFTVLASLAPRHTEALQQLAGLQANQMAEFRGNKASRATAKPTYSWVPYKTLFKQCQRKCVVHGDEQLRRFLQELKDHGVVEQNTGDDAEVLSYRIPHTARTLKDILEFRHT